MYQPRSVVLVALLFLFTCGIYPLVWIYMVRSEMKYILKDQSINPGLDVILALFTCGLYIIYLSYAMAQNASRVEVALGSSVRSDNAVVSILLTVFGFWIISALIIQNQLNIAYATANVIEQ